MLVGLGGVVRIVRFAETSIRSNKQTLDFIAGKSDLKMVEYGGHGIETIYSDSPPYRESDLLNRYLVGNNFQEWKTALEQAYENPSLPMEKIADIREKRDAKVVSMQNWLPMLIESTRSSHWSNG